MSASSTSRTRLLGLIFGLPLAIGLAVGVLVWQRGDAWKAKALDTLNEQIDGALSVGEVTLSWWHGFPDISVDVSDVALLQTTGDTLVAGERLGLALDFWSLLGDHPRLDPSRSRGRPLSSTKTDAGGFAFQTERKRLFFQNMDPRHGGHSRLRCVESQGNMPRSTWSVRVCWGLPGPGVAWFGSRFNFSALRTQTEAV